MEDLIYLGIGLLLASLTWGMVRLFTLLQEVRP